MVSRDAVCYIFLVLCAGAATGQMPGAPPEFKVCLGEWKTENGVRFYEDPSCAKYPQDCESMKPSQETIDLMMKPFRCEYFDKTMIVKVKEAQDLAPTTPHKCAFDVILCYLTACMGTLSEGEIKKVTKKLEEFEKKHNSSSSA